MITLSFGMLRLIGSTACLMPAASCYYLGTERPFEAVVSFIVGLFCYFVYHTILELWIGSYDRVNYHKEDSHIFWNATFIHLLPMIIFGVAMFLIPRHYVFDDWSFWITFIVTVFVHKWVNIPGYSIYHFLFGYRCGLIQMYENKVIIMVHKKNWLTEDKNSDKIYSCGRDSWEYFMGL